MVTEAPWGGAQGRASAPTTMDQLWAQAAAFQELLALEALPQTGPQAAASARQLAAMVLPAAAPPPLLGQLVSQHLGGLPPAKARFVDVSTGLRLRYLEWGGGSRDTVLLLHDAGECAEVWRPVGARLAERGYRCLAPDLRGHGESGRSLGYRYGADALAEDVKALIVALDLYVQPVALVGCGMGAAAALVLAQRSPFLAGAVLAGEFALPVAALQEEAGSAGNGSSNGVSAGSAGPAPAQGCKEPPQQAAQLSSTQLMPWWGFRAGQASAFDSVEQCAALLAHPLANLSPQLLVPLAQAAQAAAAEAAAGAPAGDAAAPVRQLLAQLGRPLQGAVASACSLLRVPERGAASRWEEEEEDEGLHPRTDPAFLFSFDPAAVLAGLPDLRCHLRLLHGGRGSWVEPADAAAMAALAAQGGAASASVAQLPSAGHWLASDQPEELLKQIVAFLEGPAIRCFSAPPAGRVAGSSRSGSTSPDGHGAPAVGAAVRRPELLDLKPLPQYASLEEAKKALGPRAIPTAAAVEAELRKLRVEEGRGEDAASSDDEGGGGLHRTALAKEPSDYFGFVG